MSLKLYSNVEKLNADDVRVHQLSGDTDGIIAAYYDKTGNVSLFMSGSAQNLGNIGIKTETPNEALTVVGNISATGGIYSSTLNGESGGDIIIEGSLIPATSGCYLGNAMQPFLGIYLAPHSLHIAPDIEGDPAIVLTNTQNTLTVNDGGLRSTKIYTGGLMISGNNIGADPAVGALPMTIGTDGLLGVEFLVPINLRTSTLVPNISGNASFSNNVSAVRFYGDGSHLLNLPTSNPFNQSLNTTNNVVFSSLSLMDGLTAHYTTIIGDLSCTGRIYAADVHAPLSVSDLTTTTKTLALSNVNSIVTGSSTSDMTITIPLNSTVPFPIGTEIKFIQLGTKKITIAATSGVNLANNSNQYKTKGQHAVIWLFQVTSNQWILAGDTSA